MAGTGVNEFGGVVRSAAEQDATAGVAKQGESAAVVPLLEACPSCGRPLDGAKCKVYCTNDGCDLYRQIIENCAGD
jgi:hypothetical protein